MPIAKGAVIKVAAIDSGESSEPERIDSRSEENIREEEKGFPIQACAASEEARKEEDRIKIQVEFEGHHASRISQLC